MEKKKNYFTPEKLSSFFMLGVPILLVIIMFIFKNTYLDYKSDQVKKQLPPAITYKISDSIQAIYNYTKNGKKYDYTLLEFKSPNCNTCKRMDKEILFFKEKYPEKINVVFYDMDLPENNLYMDFFGVVSMPVQIILDKEGNEVYRNSGFIAANDLEQEFFYLDLKPLSDF